MDKMNLTPVTEARELILKQAGTNGETAIVPLEGALSHILAENIIADINVPAHDNSAMDGFALAAQSISSPGITLKISQTVPAGIDPEPLSAGTAARIFTGAVIPERADAVILQEDTEFDGAQVKVKEVPQRGQNIRRRGHDIRSGDVVLKQGRRLQPQDIGLLASLGKAGVLVYRPLKVAIIATGDELGQPGSTLRPGQIYESNSYTLAALIRSLGMDVVSLGTVPDELEATQLALTQAAEKADCIISSGGVSVGDADYVKAAVESLGELALWKLAMKPGKPFSFGHVGAVPFFGLPGNPVAVFVTFLLLVKPFLLKLQGGLEYTPPVYRMPAAFERDENASRQEYLRVRLQRNARGVDELHPFPDQGSSVMTSASWAHGLAMIPAGTKVSQGDMLEYLPFSALI